MLFKNKNNKRKILFYQMSNKQVSKKEARKVIHKGEF